MKINSSIVFTLLFLLLQTNLQAQDPYAPSNRLKFALNSFYSGKYETAFTESNQILTAHPGFASDSVNVLAGKSLLRLGNMTESINYFEKVTIENPTLGRFSKTAILFAEYKTEDTVDWNAQLFYLDRMNDIYREYSVFLDASIHLDQFDSLTFRKKLSEEKIRSLYLRKAISVIDLEINQYTNSKHKKPATAGLLSAVIPGAGKCYLGKWGVGIISFLGTAATGLQAWEGYKKGGIKSPQFIAFGSLFLLSYTANIYGSIVQTKSYNVQIKSDFRRSIALQVDIAFDRLFEDH